MPKPDLENKFIEESYKNGGTKVSDLVLAPTLAPSNKRPSSRLLGAVFMIIPAAAPYKSF